MPPPLAVQRPGPSRSPRRRCPRRPAPAGRPHCGAAARAPGWGTPGRRSCRHERGTRACCGRWCAGRRPGRARPAGAAAPRPGAAPRPPAGARRPARKPPRPPTRHPRDVPAGPARPGAGARDPGPRGRPRRRPSTPARRRRARVISSIRLACWPTRSMAVIPPSTVRWSGSGSRSRPSAVIAPYRRLVPARRSRQPPAGPCWSVTASPVTVNTNSPLSCCSASRSWAIRRSRSSRAASPGRPPARRPRREDCSVTGGPACTRVPPMPG